MSFAYINSDRPGFDWQGSLSIVCVPCVAGWPKETPDTTTEMNPWQPYTYKDPVNNPNDVALFEVVTMRLYLALTKGQPKSGKCITWHAQGNDSPETRLRQFWKSCRRQWHERQRAKSQDLSTVRTKSFKGHMEDFNELHPGASFEEKRHWALRTIFQTACMIADRFMKDTPEVQMRRAEALQTWEDQIEEQLKYATVAADPELCHDAPPLRAIPQGNNLCDELVQNLSEITAGVDEFFICRYVTCLLICLNTDWPRNNGFQYCCPACGNLYSPWKDSAARIKAQKVWVMTDEHTSLKLPASVPTAVKTKGVTRWAFLAEWADTATNDLLGIFKEIAAGVDESWKSKTLLQAQEEIKLLTQSKCPMYMTHMKLSQVAKSEMDYKNTMMSDKTRLWDYSDVEQNGFMGFHYKHVPDERVMSQQDLIHMIATTKSMTLRGNNCQKALEEIELRAQGSSSSSM